MCACSSLCDVHLWVCMCAHSCAIAGFVRSCVSHLSWPGLPHGRPGLGEGSWGLCVGSGRHEVGALRETRKTPGFSRGAHLWSPLTDGVFGEVCVWEILGWPQPCSLLWAARIIPASSGGLDPGGHTPLGVLRQRQNCEE